MTFDEISKLDDELNFDQAGKRSHSLVPGVYWHFSPKVLGLDRQEAREIEQKIRDWTIPNEKLLTEFNERFS